MLAQKWPFLVSICYNPSVLTKLSVLTKFFLGTVVDTFFMQTRRVPAPSTLIPNQQFTKIL